MPRKTKEQLLRIVLDSIASAGWSITEPNLSTFPLEVTISKEEKEERLVIYIWNISHGGKTRSEREYRIQITEASSPLRTGQDFKTLLLGWYDEEGVFAAFNAVKHREFGFSPSLQVSIDKLHEAKEHGIALQEKVNRRTQSKEIVVTFLPEHITEYIEDIYSDYQAGESQELTREEELFFLRNPLDSAITREDLDRLPTQRRKAISNAVRNIREEKFRRYINKIYKGKCAICGLQANLTEAAHIIQVGGGYEGNDKAGNGVLLCRNHHKAYDSGLLAITPEYKVILNEHYLAQLKEVGLAENIEKFLRESRVGEKIDLPENQEDYPNKEYLAKNCSLKGL